MKNSVLAIALSIVLIVGIAAIFYEAQARYFAPCQKPLTYRFASIDERYDIEKPELAAIMKQVEGLWSVAFGREMMFYSESGEIEIHLIYSEEQQRSQNEQKLSNKIESKKNQFKMLEQTYNRLLERYKKRQNDLKSLLSNYNQKVEEVNKAFEQRMDDGFSESEKHNIEQRARQIDNLKYRVDRRYSETESLRKRVNQKSRQLSALSAQVNRLIEAYNERFAEPRKFHQGRYVQQNGRQTVKIFQFGNNQELKAVLAHEMGHAMGLDHVENPESVMYYLMDKQNIYDLSLSEEDIEALKNRCGAY